VRGMHDDLAAWDFELPADRIAAHPVTPRDAARLRVLSIDASEPDHDAHVSDLPTLLQPGDRLVVNDSRVLPARLFAERASGARVEVLLLGVGPGPVMALMRPAKKVKDGETLRVEGGGAITVLDRDEEAGTVRVQTDPPPALLMQAHGSMPLPPYLGRDATDADRERYQTVYAKEPGSAAAPTAGLHFTPDLLNRLVEAGIGVSAVTLHVGIGTFRPLRAEDVAAGVLHPEVWHVPVETAEAVAATRAHGGRVIAVGTTALRALEASLLDGRVAAGGGTTRLFLRPPQRPRAVDGLMTNFHLPRSSLLMLVACFIGRDRLMRTYASALEGGYRFFSYGDAMLLV